MYDTAVNCGVPPDAAIVSCGPFLINTVCPAGKDKVPLFPEPFVTLPSKVKTDGLLA